MYNLGELVRRHRGTYYDYASGKEKKFWCPKIVQLAAALALAFIFHSTTASLLEAVLGIYSILIGFSFSVLFSLITQREVIAPDTKASLETELRIERLEKLHEEIFFNVSYFIVSSLILVGLVLVYYVCSSVSTELISAIGITTFLAPVLKELNFIEAFVFSSLLYFLVLETGFVFMRIVERVIYYFQQKIEHKI